MNWNGLSTSLCEVKTNQPCSRFGGVINTFVWFQSEGLGCAEMARSTDETKIGWQRNQNDIEE